MLRLRLRLAAMAVVVAVLAREAQASATDDSSLHWLVMGDWGGAGEPPFTTAGEVHVAAAMQSVAAARGSSLVLGLGDNFYSGGVDTATSPRFDETFERVFSGVRLPFHFLAGNHDWRGNVSAQVEYTHSRLPTASGRWHFPSFFYSLTRSIPGPGNMTVQLVMIDTVLLAGLSADEFALDDEGAGPTLSPAEARARVRQLNAARRRSPDTPSPEEQWAWIERTLAASRADFLVVAGHYPVFSPASHGPTAPLARRLRPLLERYGVAMYLSGHDHVMAHVRVAGANSTAAGAVVAEPPAKGRTMTAEEVARHNTRGDLYCIVSGRVYDMSAFAERHPGGYDAIARHGGLDATHAFLDNGHHSKRGIDLGSLAPFFVADVASAPAANASVARSGGEGEMPGVDYHVLGAAHGCLPSLKYLHALPGGEASLRYYWAGGHAPTLHAQGAGLSSSAAFASLRFSGAGVDVAYHDGEARLLYTAPTNRRLRAKCAQPPPPHAAV